MRIYETSFAYIEELKNIESNACISNYIHVKQCSVISIQVLTSTLI